MADINNDGFSEVYVTDMLPEGDARLKNTTDFERLGDFTIGPIGNERENEPVEVNVTLGREGIVCCEASTTSQGVVSVQSIGALQRAFRLEKSDFADKKIL